MRVPRYEPASGMTRLETVRVSQASAEQRRGRAGRLAPGRCYRLWREAEQAQLARFTMPEILQADLADLLWPWRDGATAIPEPTRGSIRRRRRPMPKRGAFSAVSARSTPPGA